VIKICFYCYRLTITEDQTTEGGGDDILSKLYYTETSIIKSVTNIRSNVNSNVMFSKIWTCPLTDRQMMQCFL